MFGSREGRSEGKKEESASEMAKPTRTRRDAGSISFSEGDKFLDYRCPLVSEA